MSAARAPMVVAAARMLCARGADQCSVDFDDSWKVYGENYLEDAQHALDAAGIPELLNALQLLWKASNGGSQDEVVARLRARRLFEEMTGGPV